MTVPNKYEITDIAHPANPELHRIRALRDIPRYGVKAGDLGGFVESEANLSQEGECWVAGEAIVGEHAQVYGNARVNVSAWVKGSAQVYGNAWVSDYAQVYEHAKVYGDATVSGWARMCGTSKVCGGATVSGGAWVSGNRFISGDDVVYKHTPREPVSFSVGEYKITSNEDGTFRVSVNGEETGTYAESLDGALLIALSFKYEGADGLFPIYASKMLGIT